MFVLYVKILNLRVDLDTATWQSLVHTQINFMNVSKTSLCQLPMKSLLTIHGVITGAQLGWGTGLKMQTVSFFQRYIVRDISLT